MIKIYLIIILIITSIIFYILLKSKKDKYIRFLPPFKSFEDDFIYKYINTPLTILKSEIVYKNVDKLPSIFIYNPDYLCPVRKQGKCGACWAFVIADMLSDDTTIRIGNFGKELNVQQLLSCYENGKIGCGGASPEDVLKWMEKTNFKLSISNEYRGFPTECIKADEGISIAKGSVNSICEFIEDESLDEDDDTHDKILEKNIKNMKSYIVNSGCIYSSLSVYSDLINFKGDRVYEKKSDKFIGGHTVQIIGWCDKGIDIRKNFKDGYWVCKNTWGTNWSKYYDFPGYFAIKMGMNECGIESRSGNADPNVKYSLGNGIVSQKLVYTSYKQLLVYIYFKNKNQNIVKLE